MPKPSEQTFYLISVAFMSTYHIHIKGQIQGVGFRPFIHHLAEKHTLNGTVANSTDGVHIFINATESSLNQFTAEIKSNSPPQANIISIRISKVDNLTFNDFRIVDSIYKKVKNQYISPDFGICEECKNDLFNPSDRRYHYPFITCTHCGPRLSIMTNLPYDRSLTTMTKFRLCNNCSNEYNDVKDRRYYSQTDSCHECGVILTSETIKGDSTQQKIATTVSLLKAGYIVGVKNTGGYLLMCDATNPGAVTMLRHRKQRPDKPFALLYPDIAILEKDVCISHNAFEELNGIVFPIVLCPIKNPIYHQLCIELIAPGLNQIGAMLPGSPLLSLISSGFNGPLIATSGNISGSPILYEDDQAAILLSPITDHLLSNNREIMVPQDDSVIKFSTYPDTRIIIRRSRGLAPTYWPVSSVNSTPILALGADMKSAFAIANGENIYISQYLGDLTSFDTQHQYNKVLRHYLELTAINPEIILYDLHPDYHSSSMKEIFPEAQKIGVQHHEAHFMAGMFEHHIPEKNEPVLGVIWDGVGYGTDGNIWGGEFFSYENGIIERISFFEYFDYFLGDKMSLEPRLAAFSLCKNVENAESILKTKFTDTEWNLYTRLLAKHSGPNTSSMGRIFDGVASLLGLGDKNTYEGEAALYLEQLATEFIDSYGIHFSEYYDVTVSLDTCIETTILVRNILIDLENGIDRSKIAAKFHRSLIDIIVKIAVKYGFKHLVFSGGVFQNALLVDMIQYHLQDNFTLYFHKQVSPNDENIALGQLAWYWHQNNMI